MSIRRRHRITCQDCGNRCQARPTEILIHQNTGHLGYWRYYLRALCPICRAARLDWLDIFGRAPQLVHNPA